GIAARDFELRVLCDPDARNRGVIESSAATVIPFVIARRFDSTAVDGIKREIREFGPEILHLCDNRAVLNGLRAARGTDLRIVVYRGNVGNVNVLNPLAWLRYLNPRVDRIVCVSDSVRDYLANVGFLGWRLPPERLVTIHKGHDLAWYTQAPVDLEPLGVPHDAFVVGCVANWRPRKGIEILIDACERLSSDVPVHLVLVGDMGKSDIPQRVAASPIANRVHVLGVRPDAPAVAAAFDVAVLPAVTREGLPKTVIEAMAFGVTTIASRVGGVAELIEDGVSGIIVPPGDARALAEAIARLHGDSQLRASLGRRAKERIGTRFRVEDTIDKTAALYRSLVAR
ncbi:MAG: glycosyltransferase, partial [Gammaproteobacteria bacterium]|nr:glycosyltransferase [Gammaproteobacteria bacterium]